MLDVKSLTPPSPGMSATLLSKGCESYSPKGPENVNRTLNPCTGYGFYRSIRFKNHFCYNYYQYLCSEQKKEKIYNFLQLKIVFLQLKSQYTA